ncbi:protein kinase domain-containing protein [Actinoplanes sp. CA-051413]|uniref:serine/threonine-protein kinase n=1 Tax=Actinoplanes sp. CA-051413 TaxID=3239899 RepID=UPI003D973B19
MEGAQLLGGRYALLDEIGVGGMAVVWRARDEVLGRPVAVKLLAGKHAGEPDARDRIRAEARAAAALSHPNIAQVYDYGEARDNGASVPYVVMELVRGGTLQDRMDAGPMSPRFAMRVAAEVSAALAAAHADGLVHRDIKPANVMLTETGAKVVDFGIAAAINPAGTGDEEFEVLGTPAYLAPERLTGDGVEPASDVYALGVLLYRMLSGHSPWSADTTTQMLNAHVYIDPEPLPVRPGVPDYITALCNRCLSKDTTERPSAREAAALLAQGAGLRVVEDATPAGEQGPSFDNEPSVLIRPRSSGAVAAGPGVAVAALGDPSRVPPEMFHPPRPAVPDSGGLGGAAGLGGAGAAAGSGAAAAGLGGPGAAAGLGAAAAGPAGWHERADVGGPDAAGFGRPDAASGFGGPAGTDARGPDPAGGFGGQGAGAGSGWPGAQSGPAAAAGPGAAAGAGGPGAPTSGPSDPVFAAGSAAAGSAAAGHTVRPAGERATTPPHTAVPPTDPHAAARRRRRRVLPLIVAVALLGTVGLLWWLINPDGTNPDRSAAAPMFSAADAASLAPSARTPSIAGKPSAPAGAPTPGRTGGTGPAAAGEPGGPPGGAGFPPPVDGAPAPTTTEPGAGPEEPEPTTAAPTTEPPEAVERTFTSDGGSVRATCPSASTAELLSASPKKPYKVNDSDYGPGSSVYAVFKHGNDLVRLTVTCSGGIPSVD